MSGKRRLQSSAKTEQQATVGLSRPRALVGGNTPRATTSGSASNSTTEIRYQHPAHFPLQAKEKRQLDSLVATYNSENSQARRYIADAMRVLGDAAGDLAELVPAVDFTVKKEGEGEGVSDEEQGEEKVKKVGKKLLIEMESKAREMVDRGWEAGVAGEVVKGRVVKVAMEGLAGEGEEEKVGLWEVYEEEMGKMVGKRGKMPLKERWVCILIQNP